MLSFKTVDKYNKSVQKNSSYATFIPNKLRNAVVSHKQQ